MNEARAVFPGYPDPTSAPSRVWLPNVETMTPGDVFGGAWREVPSTMPEMREYERV